MAVLSTLYAFVARVRRRSYERHPERRRRLSHPVVSVGNLSVGGSGKTPAVQSIARLLAAEGERPAILTRGYRRRDRGERVVVVSDGERMCADVARAGDEPLMLARTLPGIPVIVGADRYEAGRLAEQRLGATVHVLDDGFQHVRLARDVDIVLVAEEDLSDRVLPAGLLREDAGALSRADAIVETKPGLVSARALAAHGFHGPTFAAERHLDAAAGDLPVFAVAGIARPDRFFDALVTAGWRVAGRMAFPDHHWFTAADLERMARAADACGAARIVTTEKDLVRLLPLRPFPIAIDAVPLVVSIEPADTFRAWLLGRLAVARAQGPRSEVRGPRSDIGHRTSDCGRSAKVPL